jgi:hypothetical protein
MKKNSVFIFLVLIGLIISFVFYRVVTSDEYLTVEEVKSQALEKCKTNDYDGAFNFLSEQLDKNPNCEDGMKGREELIEIRDRVFRVKDIN